MTDARNAIVLVAKGDPEQKPQLYACPKCGGVHSPRIYLAREEVAHQAAREAAENCYSCREHNICSRCGAQTEKFSTMCNPCRREKAFEKAEKIDPATLTVCFGWDGDIYNSAEEAQEANEPWVFAAEFVPFQLSADSIIESMLSDHHEDASLDDLEGVSELKAAIKAFNEAQTGGSYFEDRKRIAVLKEQGG